MAREIAAQPEVLERLLGAEAASVARIAAAVRAFDPSFAMLVARGSSDNAAVYGKYILGAANRMPVALAAPSLFTLYRSPPNLSRALVVAISQSGESPDLLGVADEARRQGALTVAVTNRPSSPLAALCRWVIPLHAGAEHSVAATKSYTAQLMALAMLSTAIAGTADHETELRQVPKQVSRAMESEVAAEAAAEKLHGATRCVVIGRGFDNATAGEIALKIEELAAIAALPYSAADFMHGPVAMLEPGFPALLIAPSGETFSEMRRLAAKLVGLGADLATISDDGDLLRSVGSGIPIGCSVPDWLTPFVTVVAGQWLSLHLALAKGLDPDHPRHLSKVTRTR